MREVIGIEVSAADRERLAAVVADGNSLQKHVWRARIILATGKAAARPRSCAAPGFRKPCVALGRAVYARRGGWPAAQEDQKAWSATVAAGAGQRGRADAHRAARRADALDRPGNGDGHWRVAALGAADLGRASLAAAPGAAFQAVAGSDFFRQAARRRWAVSRPAGP